MTVRGLDERAVFNIARRLDTQESRQEYLGQVCGDDRDLRQRIEVLLQSLEEGKSFLESPPARVEATLGSDAIRMQVGRTIGPYTLREQIGEGGMGVVYVAEQTAPVQRKVALKIIKPGMASKDVVARFAAERQALAMMDHPNIARVFDGGETDTGEPYFVMELVQGLPITEYCDAQRLSTRERLALFRQVCQAVHHAHQKGIIHRDLKPSNVLVPRIDGAPVPKVIDFGVAKAVDAGLRLSEHTVYTQFAQMIGTPLYMSPEQAELGVVDVDTRSDVYSLGVLLYELLTGSTPFDRDSLKQAGFDEMRRIIREEEPPRPSAKVSTLKADALSTVSERRRVAPRALQDSLQGELDWLVMKALEKDRHRRYGSASELSDDLSRYLAGEAIHAHPPSRLYQYRKFVRRHRAAVATAVACVLLLIGGVVGITWQMLRAMNAERTAEAATITARDEANRAQAETERANQERERAIESLKTARQVVDDLYLLVGTRWIADETAPSGFQQGILNAAAKFYEQLAETPLTRPGNLSELSLVASGYERIGAIQHYLQNYEDAVEARQRTIAVIRQALEYSPGHPDIRSSMSEAQYELGQSLFELARFDEADEAFQQASTIAAELLAENMEPMKHRFWVARSKLASAATLAHRGSVADGARLARTAKDELTTISSEQSEASINVDIDRRRADFWLAKTLAYGGSLDEAAKICRQALESCRGQRTAVQQDSAPLRTLEIDLQQLSAEIADLQGDLNAAAVQYRQVLDMRRESLRTGLAPVRFFHESFFNRSTPLDGQIEPGPFCAYVETQLRLADVLRRMGRRYEAEDILGECRIATTVLVAERPGALRYRIADANVWAFAAALLAETRPAEAETIYRRARQVWNEIISQFPSAKDFVSGVHGFTSDWDHFQEVGLHFAHLPATEIDEQVVDISGTVFFCIPMLARGRDPTAGRTRSATLKGRHRSEHTTTLTTGCNSPSLRLTWRSLTKPKSGFKRPKHRFPN